TRWQQWQTIAPVHTRWLNAYGPTETTITATIYEPSRETPIATTAMPIGQPIANVTTHVLDEHLQSVPNGVVGELYIGGVGMALGYLARPGLTEQAFITHPQNGRQLYKTGDLVRHLADGNLAFMGRADNQTKVRGFRIELGEIESALRLHPQVRDCLVVTRELDGQPTQLVAYCVMADANGKETAVSLRQFLQTHLPSYMIPATFITLEQFSYTPNGKIDHRALPAPMLDRSHAYVAPTTETEHCVADIWADVLNSPKVGIHDNFFDLGGHSLIATQIVSRIRQALQVELPIRTLFESQTVAELVKNLPTTDLFDESEEALLADLMNEFESIDFDELEDLI
ncbi:MAG: AMP-binding protein, partial [Chloroflexi bacterium]|nr:AMP-binding protein [Chloroflexota bacterium]